MTAIDIVAIAQDHIEGFHRALDVVARERRYLAFLEAPPIEATRTFVLDNQARPSPVRGRIGRWPSGRLVRCDADEQAEPSASRSLRNRAVAAIPRPGDRHEVAYGLHRVELTVLQNNTGAIGLYKKEDFEIEGIQCDAVLVDGVYENVVCMAVGF
jgi:hypothetical protein